MSKRKQLSVIILPSGQVKVATKIAEGDFVVWTSDAKAEGLRAAVRECTKFDRQFMHWFVPGMRVKGITEAERTAAQDQWALAFLAAVPVSSTAEMERRNARIKQMVWAMPTEPDQDGGVK